MGVGCHSVGGYSVNHDRGRAGDCRCGVKCQCALINRVRAEERERKMAAADIAFLDAVDARAKLAQAEAEAEEAEAYWQDSLTQWLDVDTARLKELREMKRQLQNIRNQIADEIMAKHGGVMCYHAPAADVSYRVCTHLEDAATARGEQ
jgi:hypothetical protein